MDREALIDKMAAAINDVGHVNDNSRAKARRALAAIESAGLKLMGREPTEECLRLASDARAARVTAQFEKIVISTRIPVHKCRFVYQEIWDAAPTYTDKGEGE